MAEQPALDPEIAARLIRIAGAAGYIDKSDTGAARRPTKNAATVSASVNSASGSQTRNEEVSLSEILSPTFLAKHTRFKTAGELLRAGGIDPANLKDFADFRTESFTKFIAANTPFENFDEMLKVGVTERVTSRYLNR